MPVLVLQDDIDEVRNRVFAAVDRPLGSLTVEDICQKAGISKQTFYTRFSSKFDISNWFCHHYEAKFLYEVGRTLTWEEGLLALFRTYAARGRFLYYTSTQTHADVDPTKSRHRAAIVETLEDYRGVKVTQDIAFLIEAFLELEVFLAGEWFKADLNPSPEKFTELFLECIPRKLYDLMQLPEGTSQAERQDSGSLFARYYPQKL